jgi:hypothetical protein
MQTKLETTLKTGDRVELHPRLDRWMRGDRFGVVREVGRKFVHVRMDRSGQVALVDPADLELVR